jgi:hypothetical protein
MTYYFRIAVSIFSNGKHVGRGDYTTESNNPNDDKRQQIVDKVYAGLRKAHPGINFSVTVLHVDRNLTEEYVRTLPNRYLVELT